mgnify:CR=1 FL=1
MKNIKITALSFLLLGGTVMSCKDQLDIQNPNQPISSKSLIDNLDQINKDLMQSLEELDNKFNKMETNINK